MTSSTLTQKGKRKGTDYGIAREPFPSTMQLKTTVP